MKVEDMAEEYFENVCLHSYADTEEQLREDVVAAFLAGFKACAKARLNITTISDNLIKDEQFTKAIELLKWALHSDPEHDNLDDFDTKWKEAEQFLKEVTK